jgi:Zn finger protein HypA/HybF involved in hydrogenase expression
MLRTPHTLTPGEGTCTACGSRRKKVLGGRDVTLLEIGGA